MKKMMLLTAIFMAALANGTEDLSHNPFEKLNTKNKIQDQEKRLNDLYKKVEHKNNNELTPTVISCVSYVATLSSMILVLETHPSVITGTCCMAAGIIIAQAAHNAMPKNIELESYDTLVKDTENQDKNIQDLEKKLSEAKQKSVIKNLLAVPRGIGFGLANTGLYPFAISIGLI